MIKYAPGVLGQQTAAGAAFNPETDITWHSLFWAESTAFAALGLSDGGAVTTWPNETGETDATQGTAGKRPLYRATYSGLNSQPAVEWDGTDDAMATAAMSVAPTAPFTYVVVLHTASGASGLDSLVSGTSLGGRPYYRIDYTGAKFLMFAGAEINVTSPAPATNTAYLFHGEWDGGAGVEEFWIDGTQETTGSAGAHTLTAGLVLGAQYNSAGTYFAGAIALMGIYEGRFTDDAAFGDFKTWVTDHYGITLA